MQFVNWNFRVIFRKKEAEKKCKKCLLKLVKLVAYIVKLLINIFLRNSNMYFQRMEYRTEDLLQFFRLKYQNS